MTTIPFPPEVNLIFAVIALLLAFLLGRNSKKPITICPTPKELAQRHFFRRHQEVATDPKLSADERMNRLTNLAYHFKAVFGDDVLKEDYK